MADRLAGGQLADLMASYRTDGMSWDDIARKLYGLGVEANGETLRLWAKTLGITDESAAAAAEAV